MTLAQLEKGCRYRIESVDCDELTVQRLMVLGLVEGTEIELASTAIGGDPIEYRLFGNSISLRREHAVRFQVTPIASFG